jgi:flagellar hook-basal body complex protein FliE
MAGPEMLSGLRAIAAYARNAQAVTGATDVATLTRADRVKDAVGPLQESKSPAFSSVLSARMDQLDTSIKQTEQLSAKAMLNQASSVDVITAIAETEYVVLQVREMHQRIISSLQELFKTPI